MSKKHGINKRFWTVAIIATLLHLIVLLVIGGYTVYQIVVPSDAEFRAPPPVERLELQQLEYQAQIERLQDASAPPTPQQALDMDALGDMAPPSIDLDGMNPVVGRMDMGGVGAGGMGTLGGGRGLGFGAQAFEFLGIRSEGERVVIIIETSVPMLEDRKGGIDAYQIIKDEATRLIAGLPPGTLFNVFFTDDSNRVRMFSQNMVAATPSNKQAVADWIEPVNTDRTGRRVASINFIRGGVNVRRPNDSPIPNHTGGRGILHALEAAMTQQADSVFLITPSWFSARHVWTAEERAEAERRARWTPRTPQEEAEVREINRRMYDRAREIFEEENRRRAQRGQAARVISGLDVIVRENNLRDRFPIPERLERDSRPSPPNLELNEKQRFLTEVVRKHYPPGVRPSLNFIVFGEDSRAVTNFNILRRVGTGGTVRQIADGTELERVRQRS